MSVYKYSQSKVIDKVSFVASENGGCRGYLHAAPGADDKVLKEIIGGLLSKGWDVVPCTVNGESSLEVRGAAWPTKLTGYLEGQGWATGPSEYTAEVKPKTSIWQKIRNRSLQATGTFFIAADIGFIGYGWKESRWEDMAAGFSYMGGSATMMAFGHSDQSQFEIRKQVRKLAEYAKTHDLKVDPQDVITALSGKHHETPVQRLLNVFREYPAEIGNSITALAGAFIAYSAGKHRAFAKFDPEQLGRESIESNRREGIVLKPEHAKMTPKEFGEMTIKAKRKGGYEDIGLGLTTVASGLTAALVKEKVKDPDEPKTHGLKRILEWVQERPLRVAGYGYMISTAFHAFSTWGEFKDAKITNNKKSLRAVPFRAAFIILTVIGEILLTLSSKGHGEGVKADHSTDDSIISVAASMIAKQPERVREEAIIGLSKFLGRPDVLAIKDTEAADLLRKKVSEICQNPWAGVPHGSKVCAPAVAGTEPAKPEIKQHAGSARAPKPLPDWKAKISSPAEASNQPQMSS